MLVHETYNLFLDLTLHYADSCIAVLVSRASMSRLQHRETLLLFSAFHSTFLIPSLGVIYRANSPDLKKTIVWVDRDLVLDRRFWFLAISMMTSAL
jgi:hypothetical protein